ncbi:hypothetical protein [Planococcus ruber]|uniref:hypothetical protein n=1 Tax=Planococcus ruber TaxID=2027871 RepID=UPI001FF0535E|nr:hypothetical protein [Planococcus ruber]MCJ1907685.1 hypothetical protein [Planococcus ruber]
MIRKQLRDFFGKIMTDLPKSLAMRIGKKRKRPHSRFFLVELMAGGQQLNFRINDGQFGMMKDSPHTLLKFLIDGKKRLPFFVKNLKKRKSMKEIGVRKDLPKGKMYSKRNRIGPLNEDVEGIAERNEIADV